MNNRYREFRAGARYRIPGILLLCVVGFLLLVSVANAAGGIYIGPNPDKGEEGRLIFMLEPGEVVEGEVVIVNNGDDPVELVVYAADAFNSDYGSVSFCELGEEAGNGVGEWFAISASEVSLEAKEGRILPFTLTVPPDARPGEYQAGILAQGKIPSIAEGEISDAGEGETPTVQIRITSRSATRARVFIPGPREAGLAIDSIEQVWHGTNVGFDVEIRNTGNVPIEVEGTLEVSDGSGKSLGSFPISIPSLLSWNNLTYPIDTKTLLPPGQYSVSVGFNYESVAQPMPGETEGAEPVASPTGTEHKSLTFEMSEEQVEKAVEEKEKAGLDVEPWTKESRGFFDLPLIVVIGGGVLLVIIIILLVLLLRRRRDY